MPSYILRILQSKFVLSSFGIGLNIKGSIFDILNILFSYFIIASFFRRQVLKFIDLYLSRQACKVNLSFIRVTGKFVSFSLSVSERGGVVFGDGGGGGGGG